MDLCEGVGWQLVVGRLCFSDLLGRKSNFALASREILAQAERRIEELLHFFLLQPKSNQSLILFLSLSFSILWLISMAVQWRHGSRVLWTTTRQSLASGSSSSTTTSACPLAGPSSQPWNPPLPAPISPVRYYSSNRDEDRTNRQRDGSIGGISKRLAEMELVNKGIQSRIERLRRRTEKTAPKRTTRLAQLVSALHLTEGETKAREQVWQRYTDLFSFQSAMDGEAAAVKLSHHRATLRAIGRGLGELGSKHRRLRWRHRRLHAEPALVRPTAAGQTNLQRFDQTIPRWDHAASVEYRSQVEYIFNHLGRFSQVSQDEVAIYPNLEDYNAVLQVAHHTGDIELLASTWRKMRAVEEEHGRQALGLTPQGKSSIATTRAARAAMAAFALSIGALERHTRRLELTVPWTATGKHEARKDPIAYAKRLHRVRDGAQSAAKRALDFLRDMDRRNLPIEEPLILELAYMLRTGRSFAALNELMGIVYGIDLKNIDTSRSRALADGLHRRQISSHLLTEIVRLVGETRPVSELVAVFESLRNPLPIDTGGASSMDAQPAPAPNESIFKMSFKGLFHTDKKALDPSAAVIEADQEATVKTTSVDEHGAKVHADIELYVAVAQAACQPLGPSRSDLAGRPIPNDAESQARLDGLYLPVARYVVNEALDQYRQSLLAMSRRLGLKIGGMDSDHATDWESAKEKVSAEEGGETLRGQTSTQKSADEPTSQKSSPDGQALEQQQQQQQQPYDDWLVMPSDTPPVYPLQLLDAPSRPALGLFTPVYSHASKERSRSLIRWLDGRAAHATSLLRLEAIIVEQAMEQHERAAEVSTVDHKTSRRFIAFCEDRLRLVTSLWTQLSEWHSEVLGPRTQRVVEVRWKRRTKKQQEALQSEKELRRKRSGEKREAKEAAIAAIVKEAGMIEEQQQPDAGDVKVAVAAQS